MTDAALLNLISDALLLWGSDARAVATQEGIVVDAPTGPHLIIRGALPVRWRIDSPGPRRRAVPSVTALLSVLRWSLDVPPGLSARVAAP